MSNIRFRTKSVPDILHFAPQDVAKLVESYLPEVEEDVWYTNTTGAIPGLQGPIKLELTPQRWQCITSCQFPWQDHIVNVPQANIQMVFSLSSGSSSVNLRARGYTNLSYYDLGTYPISVPINRRIVLDPTFKDLPNIGMFEFGMCSDQSTLVVNVFWIRLEIVVTYGFTLAQWETRCKPEQVLPSIDGMPDLEEEDPQEETDDWLCRECDNWQSNVFSCCVFCGGT